MHILIDNSFPNMINDQLLSNENILVMKDSGPVQSLACNTLCSKYWNDLKTSDDTKIFGEVITTLDSVCTL